MYSTGLSFVEVYSLQINVKIVKNQIYFEYLQYDGQ
jgi:hypothetical protein